jgi:hypothetical protein
MKSPKQTIQDEYENGVSIEALRLKHGVEKVQKYIEDQLCCRCDGRPKLMEYDDDGDYHCAECHAEVYGKGNGYPEREPGESDSEYWQRVGRYAASLDDYDVAVLEYELFGTGE